MIPFYNSVNGGPPEPITALTPVAWYRYGVGITVTGQGVSTWADQSGNGRDLLQATDGARPPLQSDNSILFNGTDEFLQTAGFIYSQPVTTYILFKQVTWSGDDYVFDGVSVASNVLLQNSATATPDLVIFAGTAVVSNNSALALNTYGVSAAVFNGASSLLQINTTIGATGNAGASNAAGLTLGGRADSTRFSNIQVKEFIGFAAAHDAATRTAVITYLATVGGL